MVVYPEDEGKKSLRNVGSIYKITRRHISEDGTRTLCCCLNTKLFSMLRCSAMVTLEYMLLWNVMEVGCQLHVPKPLPSEYGLLYPLNMDGTTA